MLWQDIVIALCQVAFIPAMLPSILGPDKPALKTSVLNSIIVAIITVCLFTLELWLASVTAAMVCGTWVILAYQKWKLLKI